MSGKFCVNCGQQLEENDKFCHICGATAERQKNGYSAETHATGLHSASLNEPIYPQKRHSNRNLKPLILIPIILFSIAVPFIVISSIGSIQQSLGTLDYEITSMEYSEVELNIANSLGFIDITYDDSLDSLFEATIDVRGGIKASFDDAKNFQHQISNNKTIITFDSDDDLYSFWNFKSLTHNIFITLNPDAVVDFMVHSSTGSVELVLDDIDDIVLEDVTLSSNTGSIGFHSGHAMNTSIGDVSLSTDTGRIMFDFDDAIDTSIEKLSLIDSTGSVSAHLGEAMNINSASILMTTSTGSVTLTFENILFNDDTTWDLETSTGSITIEFTQTNILPINFTSNFNVETSTGSIVVDGEIANELGIEVNAATSTGSINLPGEFSSYISPDYHLKDNQFSFILLTSTGSITADFDS